ncbi:unnamed protein product [Ixodes persulcatus]
MGVGSMIVTYLVVPVTTATVLLLLMLKRSRKFQEVFSAHVFFPLVSPFFRNAFLGIRREIMQNLNHIESRDPELIHTDAIRALEVGVGSGRNFDFVDRNIKYLAVDPNISVKAKFLDNQSKHSNIELESWILACGEDMRDVPDDYVDAVVITHVLCSVLDARKVLSECKRVLVPGGKMLFMEHIGYPGNTWTLRLQRLVDPVWELLTCGCHLSRSTTNAIIEAGFSELLLREVYLPIFPLLSRHIYGVATKSRS